MSEVEARKIRPSNGAAGLAFLGGSRWRGVFAATVAALVLGGAGLGAAAATGNEPARKLFGISSDSAIKVEFTGVIVEASATELRIDAGGDLRIVVLDNSSSITQGGDDETASIADLLPGTIVEIHGRLLADNTIVATRVHIEDDDGISTPGATQPATTPTRAPATPPPPAPTAAPATVPAAQPTLDDDDDGGPGSGDDDSGPGVGDDDGGADDDSGPGGSDDGADDDSGSGGSDDDGADDDSGPGGSDDGSDDDSESGGSDGDDGGDD